MAVKPDGAPTANSEAAAHRRWLITIALTILFGGFGAVMAYLSYANSNKPSVSSPRRPRPSGTSPSTAPSPAPSSAPATPPTAAPPAAEPASDEGDKGKADKGKPDQAK
jgi:hypothetical protein